MDALAVFINSLVVDPGLLNFDGAYTGLNRPGRQLAVSDDQPISTGITPVFVLGDIFDHFVFNGRSQHLLSPLSQDFRQHVPTFG